MGDIIGINWLAETTLPHQYQSDFKPGFEASRDFLENRKRNVEAECLHANYNHGAGKRQKTTSSSEDDDSWMDELFLLDAEDIDVQPVNFVGTIRQQQHNGNNEPIPLLVAPHGPQNQQDFLANVVGGVLSKIGNVEDNETLLGEFSRSFMTDDTDVDDVLSAPQKEIFPSREDPHTMVAPNCSVAPQTVGLPQQVPVSLGTQAPPRCVERTMSVPTTLSARATPVPYGAADSFSPPHGMSELESTKFTINAVKECEQPMLLTLTSFPFRVLYANSAYTNMTGGDSSIIGKTFYDIFVNEGKDAPSFGACPSLMGQFNEDIIVRVRADNTNKDVYATIQVHPILKKSDSPEAGLRYHAVTLRQVQVPKGASIVYLPMPSGSMVKF